MAVYNTAKAQRKRKERKGLFQIQSFVFFAKILCVFAVLEFLLLRQHPHHYSRVVARLSFFGVAQGR